MIWCFLIQLNLSGQQFECDGTFFVMMYSESEGRSKLYNFSVSEQPFVFSQIPLSQNRKLIGLSYNTNDLHLWAIDVQENEMVRINANGDIESMGYIENMDPELSYSSGLMSPDGETYFFLGYNNAMDKAQKFFEIDLTPQPLFAQFDDISASGNSRILDMAVDPVFGTVYGYNNLNGTIVQFGIDGQIATISQSRRDEQGIEALFFDRRGDMYGYTKNGELYLIDKVEGNLKFLQRGPQGTLVDGCSCPYTSAFSKDISNRNIVACDPFEVRYTFRNNLGISQTGVRLRDTFPEGFQILDVISSVPYTSASTLGMDNILALNNMIYLMGANTVRVLVQPPTQFVGTFSSQAYQGAFPAAFSAVHRSDDPQTEVTPDKTTAEIISMLDADLDEYVEYSCDGLSATIKSPVSASTYQWNNGAASSSIKVNATGNYVLRVENECFSYMDSVLLTEFIEAKSLSLGDDIHVDAGDSVLLIPQINRGTAESFTWRIDGAMDDCTTCNQLLIHPDRDISVEVEAMDSDGCLMADDIRIFVEYDRQIYAPNAFSPNGDGINDVFYLSSAIPGKYDLSIYNRWGNRVFENNNVVLSTSSGGWDGTMDGEYLGSGPYLWVAKIEFINGLKETLSGDFLLIGR